MWRREKKRRKGNGEDGEGEVKPRLDREARGKSGRRAHRRKAERKYTGRAPGQMSSATSPSLLVKTQFEIHELEKNQLGNVPYFLSALSKKSSEGEQDRARQSMTM